MDWSTSSIFRFCQLGPDAGIPKDSDLLFLVVIRQLQYAPITFFLEETMFPKVQTHQFYCDNVMQSSRSPASRPIPRGVYCSLGRYGCSWLSVLWRCVWRFPHLLTICVFDSARWLFIVCACRPSANFAFSYSWNYLCSDAFLLLFSCTDLVILALCIPVAAISPIHPNNYRWNVDVWIDGDVGCCIAIPSYNIPRF